MVGLWLHHHGCILVLLHQFVRVCYCVDCEVRYVDLDRVGFDE